MFQQTDKKYGALPSDLGKISLNTEEMIFWQYCPIKIPKGDVVLPDNLGKFAEIVQKVSNDCSDRWEDSYVYLTAKTLWVGGENSGNRPGWHSDGFLTDDLNYIWYDSNPTIFYHDGNTYQFWKDHQLSMKQMEDFFEGNFSHYHTYPIKHLLKLDERCVHKVADMKQGMRTFVKVSVSFSKYALKGNSINHGLPLDIEYKERSLERNCPTGNNK